MILYECVLTDFWTTKNFRHIQLINTHCWTTYKSELLQNYTTTYYLCSAQQHIAHPPYQAVTGRDLQTVIAKSYRKLQELINI